MGFGLGFPILLLSTLGILFFYFRTKRKTSLYILSVLWGLAILIAILSTIFKDHGRPIRLRRSQIIGEYNIDTTFYPGENAQWQYQHFRFIITKDDSLTFYILENEIPLKTYTYKIHYSYGPPDLLSIETDSTAIHILHQQPTLYRGPHKFYYVFESEKFGNMFFRKKQDH